MLRKLLENNNTDLLYDDIYSQTFNCGNGYYNNTTKKCICYPGWKSHLSYCDFSSGNTTDNNLKKILNITSNPFFEHKRDNINIIFLFIIINICLIFVLGYYYNKTKKNMKKKKKAKKKETYISDKDKMEYELNYINSSICGFMPNFYPSYSITLNTMNILKENKQFSKNVKADALESSKKKYIDLISPIKKVKEDQDDNNIEEDEENDDIDNIDDIYKV